MGLHLLGDRDSPVIPIMVYHVGLLGAISRALMKRNIAMVVVGFPATPLLLCRCRVCISAAHTREDLDYALAAIGEVARAAGIKYGRAGAAAGAWGAVRGGLRALAAAAAATAVTAAGAKQRGASEEDILKPRLSCCDVTKTLVGGGRDNKEVAGCSSSSNSSSPRSSSSKDSSSSSSCCSLCAAVENSGNGGGSGSTCSTCSSSPTSSPHENRPWME
jgi:hypothetical protein